MSNEWLLPMVHMRGMGTSKGQPQGPGGRGVLQCRWSPPTVRLRGKDIPKGADQLAARLGRPARSVAGSFGAKTAGW